MKQFLKLIPFGSIQMKYRFLAACSLIVSCLVTGCVQEKQPSPAAVSGVEQTVDTPKSAEATAPVQVQDAILPETNPTPNPDSPVAPDPEAVNPDPANADAVSETETDSNAAPVQADAPLQEQQPDTGRDVDINSYDPLTASQRQLIQNITWDADPEILNAVKAENEGMHFLRSDEKHPELFRESIENIGHTYIGIGTDQGYVFVGWQRPTLAFMVDYDPWVIVLHRIYMAIFRACDDAACMLRYFDDRNLGMEFLKSQPDLSDKTTLTVFREAHRGVTYSLHAIRRMKAKTFMNDQETFDYIKKLIVDGRLTTFQANLLGDKAFASIQSTLNQLGAKVGVLYLSNAENYWTYTKQYKTNMSELPYSDNAMIIRTIATKPFNGDYRYSVQKAEVFKAWLADPETKSVKNILGRTKIKDEEDIPFTEDNRMPKAR